MKVIIAEKPSVAREIAHIVGADTKQNGYLEGGGYAVTWALGHLVSPAMPEAYGATGFSSEHLPILPEQFVLTPRQERSDKGYRDDPATLKQLKIIKELFSRCESIIVATDAGREGELIFRYIYHYLRCTKPFERLWISSLTERAIREGLSSLKPGSVYDNLYLSAKARSEADWLIGINATQALTIAAGEGTYSLGRVQTPTLMMICSRYFENTNFQSVPYWQVRATVQKDGVEFSLLTQDRYSNKSQAEAISWALMNCGRLTIESATCKEVTQEPPLLHDLTSLQKEMNSKYGFSADKTLSVAQKLYESKFITYPRTGSKYISQDLLAEIYPLIKMLTAHPIFGDSAVTLSNAELNCRCVDDNKVTDHHALLITENQPHGLSDDEQRLYDHIAGRMVEAFSKSCIKDTSTVVAACDDTKFQAQSTVVKRVGWRNVFNESDEQQDVNRFPPLTQSEVVTVSDGAILEKLTKPKPLHTESSLLASMETAGKELVNDEERFAMKESGIGTPATRAAIIETLFSRNYIRRDKKSLLPTEKGLAVFEVVKHTRIADVQMTGMWEAALANIERGEMDAETFGQGIRVLTSQITAELLKCQITPETSSDMVCPKCGTNRFMIFDKVAKCRNADCSVIIFRQKCGKQITEKQIASLLTIGKTELIKGFKSKEGKSFNAALVFDDSYAVQLQFSERKR